MRGGKEARGQLRNEDAQLMLEKSFQQLCFVLFFLSSPLNHSIGEPK